MIELPFPPASPPGHAKGQPWTDQELEFLRAEYAAGGTPKTIAPLFGRSTAAVRNQAYKLGITVRDDAFTDAEIDQIRQAYEGQKRRGELNLESLSASMGRPKASICKKARDLGLTNIARPGIPKPRADRRKFRSDAERSAALSERMKRQHAEVGHPMQGKHHSQEARERIGSKARAAWASKTEVERQEWTTRRLKSRLENTGSLVSPRPRASWKAGWREIGGKRNYYRSRWEANYARYLEWLKSRGEIRDWQHEPETFWFEKIKRGVRSYLPDFRVWGHGGSTSLHEVKGWMDARSKTTLKRMAKYYPQERIEVIRERDYNAIARSVGRMIEGWENSGRADRW